MITLLAAALAAFSPSPLVGESAGSGMPPACSRQHGVLSTRHWAHRADDGRVRGVQPAAPIPTPLTVAPLTVASARRSLIGQWRGKLEYRDYQADKWFGLPVEVSVRDGGDGVTLIRTADFDDGPKTGIVRITSVSMLDGGSETSATFRKGRKPELATAILALGGASKDATHWTLIETAISTDNDRPAILRLTTVRNGGKMVTLKEVDFTDDTKAEWLVRNRTTLERVEY